MGNSNAADGMKAASSATTVPAASAVISAAGIGASCYGAHLISTAGVAHISAMTALAETSVAPLIAPSVSAAIAATITAGTTLIWLGGIAVVAGIAILGVWIVCQSSSNKSACSAA